MSALYSVSFLLLDSFWAMYEILPQKDSMHFLTLYWIAKQKWEHTQRIWFNLFGTLWQFWWTFDQDVDCLVHTANQEVVSHSCPLVCTAIAMNDLFSIQQWMSFSALPCLKHFAASFIPIQNFLSKLGIENFIETVSAYILSSKLTYQTQAG